MSESHLHPYWPHADATELALLAECIAQPEEVTPRLLYAAWLRQHGEPGVATFIEWECGILDARSLTEDNRRRHRQSAKSYWQARLSAYGLKCYLFDRDEFLNDHYETRKAGEYDRIFQRGLPTIAEIPVATLARLGTHDQDTPCLWLLTELRVSYSRDLGGKFYGVYGNMAVLQRRYEAACALALQLVDASSFGPLTNPQAFDRLRPRKPLGPSEVLAPIPLTRRPRATDTPSSQS